MTSTRDRWSSGSGIVWAGGCRLLNAQMIHKAFKSCLAAGWSSALLPGWAVIVVSAKIMKPSLPAARLGFTWQCRASCSVASPLNLSVHPLRAKGVRGVFQVLLHEGEGFRVRACRLQKDVLVGAYQ